MRLSMIAILAIAASLAACATAPQADTGASGGPFDGSLGETPLRTGPGSQQDLQQSAGDRVFFALDESGISAEGRQTLERQAEWLTRHPGVTVRVEGHCDERGTREYNLALGYRRASEVKQMLVAYGVVEDRISATSYGKERPAVVGSDEATWAQNRRAVTVVIEGALGV